MERDPYLDKVNEALAKPTRQKDKDSEMTMDDIKAGIKRAHETGMHDDKARLIALYAGRRDAESDAVKPNGPLGNLADTISPKILLEISELVQPNGK